MKRYTMYRESAEISAAAFKRNGGDIINALFEKDRDGGEAIQHFETLEAAAAALKNERCTYHLTKGWANVSFYVCTFYYIEAEEYDENGGNWEISGEYTDFAAIEN